ncbi:MAG: aldehyde dehydrogenase [Halobacteriovoraceae bacterium]|nr:aldehyde dehydrogenase [Halobacteriovoraceae bacterium]
MEQYTDSYAKNKVQNLVINADHSEVDIAGKVFKRARQNQVEVTQMSIEERLTFITRLKEVILERREWIIERIQKDNGKTKTDALVSEIFGVLDHLHWLEKNTKKALKDETVATPIALMGKKSKIYYDALGTILVISPWNYPFYQAIVPITAAFVAGNTVVYKPSEFTPLEGVLEELMELSGIKSEWVQVVYGTGKMGTALIDQRPDKIFFTGSVATGKKIMRQASEQLIPVELELGGKDPAIVFEDANIERAARGVVWGALTCTGQSCTSVEQVYVHESIYEKFKAVVLSEVQKIRLGEETDGEGELGLMTTEGQVQIVADHMQDATSKGASVLSGADWDGKSRAIPPLVFENLRDDMKITNEETFGPILPLMKFTSEQDLVDKLNQSEYGLSASIWSGDKNRCERVAHALHTGNVSINNVMLTEGNPNLPFGGVKNSGIGRYKGVHGLRGFTNMKSIIFDSNSSKCEVIWYPYTAKKYRSFDKMMVALFTGGIMNFIKFALTGIGLESYSDKIAKK